MRPKLKTPGFGPCRAGLLVWHWHITRLRTHERLPTWHALRAAEAPPCFARFKRCETIPTSDGLQSISDGLYARETKLYLEDSKILSTKVLARGSRDICTYLWTTTGDWNTKKEIDSPKNRAFWRPVVFWRPIHPNRKNTRRWWRAASGPVAEQKHHLDTKGHRY